MENNTVDSRQRGFTLWFTGLSGAGKTTIAEIVEHELKERGLRVEVLDGDIVRTNLSKGLSYSREDRNINVLRIGFVANLLTRNGVGVIVSAISPYKEARDQVRRRIVDFVEVFVDAPLEVCAERDVKGLYKKAFAGEIPQFTGVSDPYEPPAAPELHIKTDEEEPHESARRDGRLCPDCRRDRHGLRDPHEVHRFAPALPPAVRERGGRGLSAPREHPGGPAGRGDPRVDPEHL